MSDYATGMRETFIRFVTLRLDEDSGQRRGVFQAVADLMDANVLSAAELRELQDLRGWFNQHLKAPDRFSRSRRSNAAPKAISWFKSSAAEYVSRMHAMCRILNAHGVATEMITSTRLGYIVFEDRHQVAAVPFADTAT